MKPPAFDYVVGQSVDHVLDLLAQHGDEARVIAGGQSLAPMMAFRLARPSLIVDLNRIDALAGVTKPESELSVGAMTRQRTVLTDPVIAQHFPALAAATRLVGHFQTRNRGTIGGSIALADPAAENPALALAVGAELELKSQKGTRKLPSSQFFTGAYTTAIQPEELITAIHYPVWTGKTAIVIDEVTRRPGDFALVGLVAALHVSSNGSIDKAGLAWFGVSSEPCRALGAEKLLVGAKPTEIDLRGASAQAMADIDPKDDHQATAAYRKMAGEKLAHRVIAKALGIVRA